MEEDVGHRLRRRIEADRGAEAGANEQLKYVCNHPFYSLKKKTILFTYLNSFLFPL